MQPIDFFFRTARARPEAIAVESRDSTMTYGKLAQDVRALAAGLQSLDSTPGSRVGICCRNSIEHLTAWLATLAAGKIWVPLFHKNRSEELRRAIDFTEASLVIAEASTHALVEGAGARVIVSDPASRAEDTTGGLLERFAGASPELHVRDLGETQAIKFTGGTTGLPKGVMQPLRAWNTCIATQIATWGMTARDAYLAAAPITHGTSTYILPILAVSGRLVLLDQPRPEETLAMLGSGRVTLTFVPPTVIYMMMQQAAAEASDFAGLRHLIYGSGPMRPDAIAQAQAMFGPVVASTYGQTEAPQIAAAITGPEMMAPDRRRSVGRPTLLTQVEVLDSDGRVLPPGETGEIAIRGDLVMSGFWKQPDKTAETIVDGWLRTGDLGSFDDEGYLAILGRSKDVVISGGFNVYPSDVEPVLASHQAVADCAVFGLPDSKWGEAVHAAVVLQPGQPVTPEEIIDFAKARLGSVKAPKVVTFFEELPRNAYGKLQKQKLIAAVTGTEGESRSV